MKDQVAVLSEQTVNPPGRQDRVSRMTLFLRGYGMKLYMQGGTDRFKIRYMDMGSGNIGTDCIGTNWVKMNKV